MSYLMENKEMLQVTQQSLPQMKIENFMRRIQKLDVDGALKKIKLKKAVWPDCLPIEVWRCQGTFGVSWLTNLFNDI